MTSTDWAPTAMPPFVGRRDRLRQPAAVRSEHLGERLRRDTHAAHLAAERSFDLESRLASLRDYGDALVVLDGFGHACASILEGVGDVLPAALRAGPAHRRERLAADLAWLGRAQATPPPAEPFRDPDHALGAWYVHEGAALGGLLIAAEVRRRLPQASPATRFFAGEGRATAARWRRFQAVLTGWDPAAGDRVLAGALATFAALTARMRETA